MFSIVGLAHDIICVAWGGGVDSSGMLVRMVKQKIIPALVTMADTGSEKEATYRFLPVFSDWLVSEGFPRPIICQYRPLPETTEKYESAVKSVAKNLGIKLTKEKLQRLGLIYGNMIANNTLPSIAFGANKSCSVKYKLQAQEPT